MQKVTILREHNNQVLLRIETLHELSPGKRYRGIRHEWWYDKEKMEQGIPGDGYHIYCSGFAGEDEAELIRKFEKEATP